MNGLELRSLLLQRTGEAFVVSTWLRSYRRLERTPGLTLTERDRAHRAVITPLLDHVWLAVRPEAPTTVHAWVCGELFRLHYVYVPPDLRGHGIARWMVGEICGGHGVASHRSRKPFEGFPYSPFALAEAMRTA
jgi:GNAT superfamily N-acetyltransferase